MRVKTMSYHSFKDDEGHESGSFEVFHSDPWVWGVDGEDREMPAGWYWHACFPGCLPDGEPTGPFETEQEAIDDAQNA